MTTCEPLPDGGDDGEPLTLWPEDSPASPSARRGRSSRRRIAGGYGPRSRTSFATYDPGSYSWKTSQVSFGGEWETYSENWPPSGTTRNGTASPLSSSVPPIYANGSSLWPTPRVADGMIAGYIEAARGRVMTPGRRWRANLEEAVALWPTPNATDWKGPGNQRSPGKERPSCDDDLPSRVGGHLNPTWVEWLMGYPEGWTDCED